MATFSVLTNVAAVLVPIRTPTMFNAAWTHYPLIDVVRDMTPGDWAWLALAALVLSVVLIAFGRSRHESASEPVDADVVAAATVAAQ